MVMVHELESKLQLEAVIDRLGAEVVELITAARGAKRCEVLDELVDVSYFCDRLADIFNITRPMRSHYGKEKAAIRLSLGKFKPLELATAERIIVLTESLNEEIPGSATVGRDCASESVSQSPAVLEYCRAFSPEFTDTRLVRNVDTGMLQSVVD